MTSFEAHDGADRHSPKAQLWLGLDGRIVDISGEPQLQSRQHDLAAVSLQTSGSNREENYQVTATAASIAQEAGLVLPVHSGAS
jgi:hypothetical protein